MSDSELVVEMINSSIAALVTVFLLEGAPPLEDVDPELAARRNHQRVEGIEPVVTL